MPIVLVRVDDRLVHGQILEGWLPSTGAQEVLVANDALAADPVQTMIIQSAVPFSVRLVVDTMDRIAALLMEPDRNQVKSMVLLESPADALRLKKAGVPFTSLNLGNLKTEESTVCLSRTVLVGQSALATLRDIVEQGVQVHIQSVPFEKPLNLVDIWDSLAGT
jgi:PTS system mannose-specific IIB component